ncbi:MAG TPA: hypothetical protein VL359_14840 [bacterium]|nr:hypothetical protein [bacterium]
MMNEPLQSERLTYPEWEAALEDFHARGWTDGLPIIPPTEDKVRALIAGSGREASEVLGKIPPRWAECSVEQLAINAVMAGCDARSMPVLVTAVEALCEASFGLYGIQATTHPCGILMVVSGPIAKELGMNWGHGCFGPGNRVNASLGRAMRLTLVNVGGAIPGQGDMATHGSPGKFSYCVAENEPDSPWEPLRVDLGFGVQDSTVTVYGAESPHNVNDHMCSSAHSILTTVASVMTTVGHNNSHCLDTGDVLVVLGPEHAKTVAAAGMTRRDVQMFLYERARNSIALLRNSALWTMEHWPKWVNKEDPLQLVPIVGKPQDIHVMVAGGSGKHSLFIPTFGVTRSVTRKIEKHPF